jgi:hypothetical protein
LEVAYKADSDGSPVSRVARLYRTAVEAMAEGMALPVQGTGRA